MLTPTPITTPAKTSANVSANGTMTNTSLDAMLTTARAYTGALTRRTIPTPIAIITTTSMTAHATKEATITTDWIQQGLGGMSAMYLNPLQYDAIINC